MKESGTDTTTRSPQSHAQIAQGQDKGRAGPSKHGAILGDALALIEIAGRKDSPVELPQTCLTCAFRRGSMPNQTAGTGVIALNIVLGIDKDRFACHHGMKEGQPSKLCVGYLAARLAPFSFTKEVLAAVFRELDGLEGHDEVQAAQIYRTPLALSAPSHVGATLMGGNRQYRDLHRSATAALPIEEYNEADTLARSRGQSVSEFTRQAVREKIARDREQLPVRLMEPV